MNDKPSKPRPQVGARCFFWMAEGDMLRAWPAELIEKSKTVNAWNVLVKGRGHVRGEAQVPFAANDKPTPRQLTWHLPEEAQESGLVVWEDAPKPAPKESAKQTVSNDQREKVGAA